MTTIKFAVNVALLTTGLTLLAVGGRWLSFTGLAMVMISGLFTLSEKMETGSIFGGLLYIGGILFLTWFFGIQKPSLFALIIFWLVICGAEFYRWRKSRAMTPNRAGVPLEERHRDVQRPGERL